MRYKAVDHNTGAIGEDRLFKNVYNFALLSAIDGLMSGTLAPVEILVDGVPTYRMVPTVWSYFQDTWGTVSLVNYKTGRVATIRQINMEVTA